MAFASEKLNVYQKAIDFADKICTATAKFPPNCYYFLSDQLNRASLSISANIAEGNGRFTKNDRRVIITLQENYQKTLSLSQ